MKWAAQDIKCWLNGFADLFFMSHMIHILEVQKLNYLTIKLSNFSD